MECFICEIFRKINTDDYNTLEHVKMRKTQTLKRKGKEREKKTYVDVRTKELIKITLHF